MNLDELKTLWQQHQEQSVKTNERLIRSMLLHRSSDAVERMLNAEYLNLSVAVLVMLVLLISLPLFIYSPLLTGCFAITLLIGLGSIGWGWHKIRTLRSLRFGNSAVAETAERLEHFRRLMAREKMVSLLIAPVLLATLLPLAHRLVHGSQPVDYIGIYGLRFLLGYVAYVLLSFLWYGRLYFRNISAITRHLDEIRAFRQAE